MKPRRFRLLASMALAITVAGFLLAPPALLTQAGPKPEKKKAKFSKAGKKTKVDRIHAARGDTVAWSDPTSDLYFQFMDASLFGVETRTVKKGSTLSLTVQAAAKNGTYHYAIFRLADSTFVIGGSPPSVIIP